MRELHRFSYSLNRAIEYLNNDLGYSNLKIDDLIHFIKKEKLTTTFQMEGFIQESSAYINSICENDLKKPIEINNITIQYTENEYSKTEPTGLLQSFSQHFENDFLKIKFKHSLRNQPAIRFPCARLVKYQNENDCIIFENCHHLTFEGYFRIDNTQYKGNDAEIVNRGYIEITPDFSFFESLSFLEKKTTVLTFFANLNEPLKLNFDSIQILHSDLQKFIGLQGKDEIAQLKAELAEKQNIIDSFNSAEVKGRISLPQKQLFALLVKKCYPDINSRKKLFDVINADLKDSEIRNTDISADTFYKLIDESNDIIKAIFPPKKS
ncbi:hypothetical protein O3886_00950 [Haemophilus sputorum]|uniref:hypothetical protein n=1 Tax=Haemophilus sputorum TaxID=1078480 RepID=UPI0021030F5B|nr:hypothetical protein [Haemophilus sputorum]MCQ1857024.1 hypothetical protein [Haemophilus sputorum]